MKTLHDIAAGYAREWHDDYTTRLSRLHRSFDGKQAVQIYAAPNMLSRIIRDSADYSPVVLNETTTDIFGVRRVMLGPANYTWRPDEPRFSRAAFDRGDDERQFADEYWGEGAYDSDFTTDDMIDRALDM
jgi:hypothetical protein